MSHFEKNYLVRLSESRRASLMELLKRVDLKGAEVPTVMEIMSSVANPIPDDGSVYIKKEEGGEK